MAAVDVSSSYSDPSLRQLRPRLSSEDRRTCWVCFATDEDEPAAAWVQPCKCKGTTRWVHMVCLQRWVDEKQAGNPTVRVYCPQCNSEYIIKYPPLGPVLIIIDYSDKIINKICPIGAASVVIGSLYWSAVTYGAVTVMQVMGHKEGLEMMEKADPLFLLVGLPTIPFGLLLGKMIKWEDYLLQVWRKYSRKFWFPSLLGTEAPEDPNIREPVEPNSSLDFIATTRILCGALLLPTFAAACGNQLFKSVQSSLRRTLLGGIVFIAVKGALKIYFKQQQYIRLSRRTIAEHPRDYADQSPSRSPTHL